MDCGQFSEQLNRTGSPTLRAGKSPGSTPHFLCEAEMQRNEVSRATKQL